MKSSLSFIFTLVSFIFLNLSHAEQNDPFVSSQWGLVNSGQPQNIDLDPILTYKVQSRLGQDLQKPQNLKINKEKVIVAVLDTGIELFHPDLFHAIHRNPSECLALQKFQACLEGQTRPVCEKIWMDLNNPEVDLDKNGYPLDCSGWSIMGSVNAAGILGRPDFSDEQGHGTHVSGIIAATSGNKIGISGVSSNISLLPVQVLSVQPTEPVKPLSLDQSSQTVVDISPSEAGKEAYRKSLGDLVARGVNYAIASKAKVINFSLGWPESNDSIYLRQVIAEAQKKGIIVVAAAGNDSTRALLRPCAYPGVICVASHGPDGALSHFSNYGTGVDIAAPGTNILSTYPQQLRPKRFRKDIGYEYLHGTSQAAPFVTGVVAEMLAQNIPANEIYPRLILGARPLMAKLPLLQGAAHDLKEEMTRTSPGVEKKWILSGQLDFNKALAVKPQPLVLPTSKEKKEIPWNRKERKIFVQFPFKNLWQEIPTSEVSVQVSFLKPHTDAIRPKITKAIFDFNQNNLWKTNQVINLEVEFEIQDSSIPEQSRIPSDLDLIVEINLSKTNYKLVLESELIVPITPETSDSEMEVLNLLNMPPMRTSLVAIDQNIDGEKRTDYLAIGVERGRQIYHLLRQDNLSQSSTSLDYQNKGSFSLNLGEDLDKARDIITARLSWDLSQPDSRYLLGVLIDESENENPEVYSRIEFNYLDADFKLQNQFKISSDMVKLPLTVAWQRNQNILVPSWVGLGKNPDRKPSLQDRWENPQDIERPEIRFYYLSSTGKLKTIGHYNGFQFIDTLFQSTQQIQEGRVPVLLAKNRGTEVKPSYIYDFATADVINGKIENFQLIDLSLDNRIYRNLLDTRTDLILSLDSNQDPIRGTFWFGEGADRGQRLSALIPKGQQYDFFDFNLAALRGTVDATLWVRASYYGKQGLGAFSFTNSEMQFHDLTRNQNIARSFERYTFYQSMAFDNLHFPITVQNQEDPTQMMPALFTTESSGLNKGVSIKTISRNQQGTLTEILVPAKLRYKSAQGCRPLDNPSIASDGTPALDYYCGNKILRMKLKF